MAKHILPILLCLILCGFSRSEDKIPESGSVKEMFAMNTYITMKAYGENAESALNSAESRLNELEALWSVTDEKSEIYHLNHSGGTPVTVSEATAELIGFALEMAEKTDGALEPTVYPVLTEWGFTTDFHRVPTREEINGLLQNVDYKKVRVENRDVLLLKEMQIDMGAIAKGFAGDITADVLKSEGVNSAIISLGGNIQTVGTKKDGSPWKIGIRCPTSGDNFAMLEVSECAVVTSGGYQNFFTDEDGTVYHHIIDPKTGMPAKNGLLSVTVVGKEGRLCDALSTALFVMGAEKAVCYWQENGGFDFILYTEQNEVIITEGLKDSFTLTNGYEELALAVIEK